MRRAFALAAIAALACGSAAAAETWTKFFTMENGADVSYDKDYVYKDRQSGRFVVMQALSNDDINARFMAIEQRLDEQEQGGLRGRRSPAA